MTKAQSAALHTLWQAAGGFATADLLINEFAAHNSHDVKATLFTAGTAVIATGLSLAKSAAHHWAITHATSNAAKAELELEKMAAAVADYNARHVAPVVTGPPVTNVAA